MEFKTAYGERVRFPKITKGESLTQQCFKKECDINNILSKHARSGLVEHLNTFEGDYRDLSEPIDYQTALNVVINAKDAFDTLPSDVRKKFNNEPGEFLAFATNPDNLDAMRDMGLANPLPDSVPAPPDPEPVETPKE